MQVDKNKLIEADNRSMVTRGEVGGGRTKRVKEVNCMVMEGN